MSALENDRNRPENDLYATGSVAGGPEECARRCADDGDCEAMTFVEHGTAEGGVCWLKGAVGVPVQATNMVSARKIHP